MEGVRLTNSDVGFSGVLADITAFQLNDGRWRLLYDTGNAIRSALSTDGLVLTPEASVRLNRPAPAPAGGQVWPSHPRALRLADGRIRLYFIQQSPAGVYSAISSDEGATFTVEDGVRLTAAAIGATGLTGPDIVQMPNGVWRMYVGNGPTGPPTSSVGIASATSSDLLTWSPDPGVRVGPGAQISGSAEHPSAFVESNGSVSLFYVRRYPTGILVATSTDGLTFTSEASTGIDRGNDPDVVALGGGSLRMYYNWGDDNSGTIYSAVRSSSGSGSTWQRWAPTAVPFGTPAPQPPGVTNQRDSGPRGGRRPLNR